MPVWKAAALSQLGRREDAKARDATFFKQIRERWNGTEPASEAVIARWFLHVHPIHLKADWERLCDGAAAAGMPVARGAARRLVRLSPKRYSQLAIE